LHWRRKRTEAFAPKSLDGAADEAAKLGRVPGIERTEQGMRYNRRIV
jgi:hypothetical protein